MQQPQCADAVLMVRPAAFDYNVETAASNRMQRRASLASGEAAKRAQAEFDRVANALRSEGIRVCVAEDTPEPPKPDAVFPNNWVSFHADGTVLLICNPIPEAAALDATAIDIAIATALAEATAARIAGKQLTPFLLARLAQVTGGASIRANRALALHNAEVGAALALALAST